MLQSPIIRLAHRFREGKMVAAPAPTPAPLCAKLKKNQLSTIPVSMANPSITDSKSDLSNRDAYKN
jgi:hypothetical protein